MQSYYIASSSNEEAFRKAAGELDAAFPADREGEIQLLPDGVICKCYHSAEGEIRLYRDPNVGAVYADSPVSLSEILTYILAVQKIK